ncbi:TonB-dependent receptor family protein [Pseudidiomarina sp.]|uniref:TonB-dependent receptor family protein n=1 Tax=Pseudidiomarina sp. TaxID=2081707 RepID=UPI00299CE79D|nr:TonB-dependent receptor [Pseudidiomarina sp.]MDX1705428.1 TonB-dependent receptor [Pseudidiomarina sp.]
MNRSVIASAISLALLSASAVAQDTSDQPDRDRTTEAGQLEIIQIIGSKADARTVAGSSAVIDEEQITIENSTDINQLLKTVPGVYVREEEGFGLRPNIGIRAAAGGRSSKVTLLEDGVMIAPAPYSNPAAYYFPEAYRLHTLEVLKGAPLLRYGPQTTGGVINMITTPIPQENSGQVTTKFGEYNTQDIHAFYGGRHGDFGFLFDTVQRSTDGFKDIDRSSRDSGFEIEDYMVKLSWTGQRQSLLAKFQYSEQVSNETYAGLTDADFAQNPNRRYGLTEIDQMDNQHNSFTLTYDVDLTDTMTLTAIGYRNEFKRDWFKGSFGSLINAANNGDANALAILHGQQDAQGLDYKHNNRAYESYGIELNLGVDLGDHQLQVGARDHSDEMDRFQPVEIYDQVNGSLVFQNVIQPTGGNNRLEGADAVSLWVTDTWQATADLLVNLAVRYENVDSYRKQYSTVDRSVLGSQRSNSTSEVLPGASFTYTLDDHWQVLGGVHRGFAPLGGGATAADEPETSTNYELGARYQAGALFAEVIGFRSDFNNQAESCSVGNPCSNGATSGNFVTGEALVQGMELQLGNAWSFGDFVLPAHLNYTWSSAEISADNSVTGVMDGDELADIPEQVFSLQLGLKHNSGWDNHIVAKFMSETCVSVGCNRSNNAFDETESLFTVDFISRYPLTPAATVFLKVDNLFDEQVIISRSPQGARPNKPQTVSVGLEYNF